MSYASDVKKELTNLDVHRENAKAELMALIRMNGTLKLSNQELVLDVQSENPAISRRIYTLLLKFYHVEAKIIVRKKMKLKKNKVYVVRITHHVRKILDDLGILDGNNLIERVPSEVLKNDGQVRSYLRGAFLAGGSVNSPETSRYHLEIYSLDRDHNDMIAEMMNGYGFEAKTTKRRSGYIVYLKEAEKISDFLELIGATNSRLRFEDVRIVRDLNNSVNRLVNCENANMNKVANAATTQIENIKYIDETVGMKQLPEKLRDVAETRLHHPEVSLSELGSLVSNGPISKSGVNHRLRRINEFAEELRDEKQKNA